MYHKDNKTELFTPGFICALHSFGRDLKCNPNIHCLISEGGVGNPLRWHHKKHFNYKLLRDSFQTAFLNELHARIGNSFKRLKASIYADHKNGFYIQIVLNKCDPSQVSKYIDRYLGRSSPTRQDIPPVSGVLMSGDISELEKIYIVCGYTDYSRRFQLL